MSGLAFTTGKRKIQDGSKFNGFFPPENEAYSNYEVLKRNGDVSETVKFIADIIKKDKNDTVRISVQMKAPTRLQTIKNIHYFMVKYLQYDTENGEKLRSPRRTWWVGSRQLDKQTGNTGVDCDDLVIFSGSILKNLNIPFFIRIVKINQNKFQHVYLIVPKSGNTLDKGYFTLDGVISDFNYEYPFKQQKTFDMNGIPIEYLGGLGAVSTAGLGDKSEQTREFLQQQYDALIKNEVFPTKINRSDLIKMLGYALKNWDINRKQALKNLATTEQQAYPGQTFFEKLYNSETEVLGDWIDDIINSDVTEANAAAGSSDNVHDWQPDTTSTTSTTSKKGSGVASVLTSLFNAAANFDWGLVGGKNKTPAPTAIIKTDTNTNKTPGLNLGNMMGSLSGYLIGGVLVYGAYKLLIEKKPIVPVKQVRAK